MEAASTLKSNLTNGTQLQNELNILYAKVAALKQNRDSSKIINHLEAIMALMPLFLTTLVPVNERKAHIDSSLESFKYYLTRLKQNPTDSQ